jgi:hypothetical protein
VRRGARAERLRRRRASVAPLRRADNGDKITEQKKPVYKLERSKRGGHRCRSNHCAASATAIHERQTKRAS